MTELRSLLLEAEPLDDAGFIPGPGVRATAARRTRHRYVAVGTVLAAALLLTPFVLRPSDGALPPVAPAPTPVPTVSPLLATLADTQWRVDLRTSGITDDPVAAPTSVAEGSGEVGLGAVVAFSSDGRLYLRNGYVGGELSPAGLVNWESRSPTGDRGWVSFRLTADPARWDGDPACTRDRCRSEAVPYWPGVEAFSRLESVVGYQLAPVPHGEPVPLGPTIGMSLLDVRGNVVLCLVLIAKDGRPVADG
jgi:hypothetical protein